MAWQGGAGAVQHLVKQGFAGPLLLAEMGCVCVQVPPRTHNLDSMPLVSSKLHQCDWAGMGLVILI